uniref:Putative secreted protein n=1 Tax=Lutzomyia longipalpis TaxID=7200 RepID=A0A7G3AH51_LUTLO
MLKLLVIAAAASIALARPPCRNPDEFGRGFAVQGSVRHFWECVAVGEAVLRECPAETEFNEEHLMCLTPGAPLPPGESNTPLKCDEGFAADLSVDPPVCIELRCGRDQIVVHPPTGVPQCFTVDCPEGHAPTQNGVCQPIANTQCPGALPESYVTSGYETCQIPTCTGSDLSANRHWPSSDPTKFYQCKGEGTPVLVDCSPNLCFDVKWQVCVFPHDWTNSCAAS